MKVCICLDVSDRLVRERARAGVSIEAVLAETKAGSACGTCQLAVRRIHAGEPVEAAPDEGSCRTPKSQQAA